MFAFGDRLWVNNKIRGRDGAVPDFGFSVIALQPILIRSGESEERGGGVFLKPGDPCSKVNFYRSKIIEMWRRNRD